MITVIAIPIVVILLLAIIIQPVLGILLLWLVELCYPHKLTESLLPLNIGFNDLFVVFVFVTIVLRKQLSGQTLRFGKFGFFLCSFWVLYLLSELYGAMVMNLPTASLMTVLLKEILKRTEYVFIGLSVINVVDDMQQVQKLVKWFLIGCIGLAIITILQYFAPQTVAFFHHTEYYSSEMKIGRAVGTTRGPWELGGVLGAAIIISGGLLIVGKGLFSKGIPLVCAILSVPAIILSTSRAGWLFAATGIIVLCILSKKPVTSIIIILMVASVLIIFPVFTEIIMHRIEYTGSISHLDTASLERLDIWREILKNLDISIFLFGLGSIGSFAKYGYTAHSFYLTIITRYGMAGIIYFIALFISLWRHTRDNIKIESDQKLLAVWKAIFAMNVGVLAYSLTTDTLETDLVGKTLFFFWSLLYLKDNLGEQVDSEYLSNSDVAYADEPYEKTV